MAAGSRTSAGSRSGGPSPDTFTTAVYNGLRELASVMQDAGYRVRTQERPLPDPVDRVKLLVYR